MLARAARCTALRKAALPRVALPQARSLATGSKLGPEPEELAPGIPENDDMATGMERQEILQKKEIAEQEKQKLLDAINQKEEQHGRLRAQQATRRQNAKS